MLYVAPRWRSRWRPVVASWLSHDDGLGFLFGEPDLLRYDRGFKNTASMVEGGVQNSVGLAGFHASVKVLGTLGPERIFGHVSAYLDALEPKLVARGFASERTPDARRRSGILAVRPPEGVSLPELAAALNEGGVSVTTPDGRLRFAPHWPNDAEREMPPYHRYDRRLPDWRNPLSDSTDDDRQLVTPAGEPVSSTAEASSDDDPPRVVRHIRPLGMRVLVKLMDAEERTASGLYLPQGVAEKHQDALYGEVIEVARTAEDEESLGENVSGVPAGARVLIPKQAGIAVPWDQSLRVVETKEVLATVEEVPFEAVN